MGSLGYLTDRWQLTGLIRGGHNERGVPGPFGSDPNDTYAGVDTVSRNDNETLAAGASAAWRLAPAFQARGVVHVREPRQHVPEHLHARHADRLEQPHVGGARASGCRVARRLVDGRHGVGRRTRGVVVHHRPAGSGDSRRTHAARPVRRRTLRARSSLDSGRRAFRAGGAGSARGQQLGLQPAAGVCRGHGLGGQPPRRRELAGPRRR